MTTNSLERNREVLLSQTNLLFEQNSLHRLEPLLKESHPVDIAQLLTSLPAVQRSAIWEIVPEKMGGEVLNELDDNIRTSLLREMDTTEVVSALSTLIEDEQADLIQDIPDRTEEILKAMDENRRNRLEAVLYFPEDVAGGLMDVDTVSVRADVSVRAVLRYLRKLGQLPETTNKLFVTDRQGYYRGQVLVITILTADADTMIENILDGKAEAITATMSAQEVADRFTKLNLISAAVIDDKQLLLGRITIDDVVDYIQETNQNSMLKYAGTVQEDVFISTIKSSGFRAVWLGINLVTALIASWVIMNFSEVIDKIVALAVLMPIVASMGGIAGTQTLSLVVRSLALGQLRQGNKFWLLKKEIGVGLLNGLLWAVIVGCIAYLWFDFLQLSLIMGVAIFINLCVATTSGVVIPVVLDRLGIDPAIAAGVILTTVTDVVGFFTFLGLASALVI